ncbi:protein of unknown function [Burkholderia multivorans]
MPLETWPGLESYRDATQPGYI